MKALSKLKAEEGIWMTDVPEPEVGHNDLLIKIRKTAICGTDVHIYNWDQWSQKTIPVPMVVGHEYVGEVVGIGQGQAAPGQLMPLRPGLSVGRRTGADAVEIGNEGVPVHCWLSLWRTVAAGGAAVGVQMGEVRFVHGKAPCRAIGSRHP